MKITYYGTSASEAWPALFCSCQACLLAKKLGGKNIRSRSQALIDTSLLIDFPPDTGYHVQHLDLKLQQVRTLLITHSHHDHFFPYDIGMRMPGFAEGIGERRLLVYGNETTQAKFQEAVRLYRGIERFVEFRRLEPFETFFTEDGYEVTSLLADHNQLEKSLMYLVKRDAGQILYAHDTGIFPECTWKFLEGSRLDLVSLDCTALSRDWRQGHMGFGAVDEVRDRLREMGCIGEGTRLVLNHFAHFGDFTHEKICEMENPKGYEVAYDGCVFVC
ncbi:MAG: hypothetical protein HFG75_13950 [Hungatella sp.]|nr:hypothetical protein [Hungatella sp.]